MKPAPVDLGMPEVHPDVAREWLEFPDPADSLHLIRADLTFLLSRWTCIYGTGCHGIEPDRPDDGCCTHGAFYSDVEDQERVVAFAGQLKKKDWQYADVGRRDGVSEEDELDGEPAPRTRIVDGACVFLNRPGFAGGQGCALHAHALRTGRHPLETKPDVCWQLPIRRTSEEMVRPDDVTIRVSALGEFDRRAWGVGGADLSWWCTSSPEAHVGEEAVYRSYAAEIIALVGAPAYTELVRLIALRGGVGLPHPAATIGRPPPSTV